MDNFVKYSAAELLTQQAGLFTMSAKAMLAYILNWTITSTAINLARYEPAGGTARQRQAIAKLLNTTASCFTGAGPHRRAAGAGH
nr:IncF plasmid conjugative transfer pilus assembly protein TraF [Escherichia coli]